MDMIGARFRGAAGRRAWLCALLAIGCRDAVTAQAPEATGLMPPGGPRGGVVTLRVDGRALQGASALLSGVGVRARSVQADPSGAAATLTLAIDPDAPLGPRELRLVTAKGVSSPLLLWVDVFANALEAEPNDDLAHAQDLPVTPVAVNGRIQAPTDRDTFAFQAGAGETWVFDGCAARLRSRLDPVLELRDSAGQTLRMAQSTWESDPRLVYTFRAAGRYYITVRDTQYQGGIDFGYRLTVGQLPLVTTLRPRGDEAGRRLGMEIEGTNLGPTRRAIVRIPIDTPPGPFWTTADTEYGPTLPFALLVGPGPVAALTETDAVMPLPLLPGALDGVFTRLPRTRFFFRATPTDHLVFDLLGRRIGSRIDGALRIVDSAGKEVAANDDAVGKDARLEFTPPKEGVYTLEAWNVDGHTGADCYYRLDVRRAEPDFRLSLVVERLQVGQGDTETVAVTVERLHGFSGEVALRADDLPPGVAFSGGTIAAGQSACEVTFTAPAMAVPGARPIRIRGEAVVAGRREVREATPRQQYLPRSIDPGMFTDDSYRQPYRACELLPLAVTDTPAAFALSVEPAMVDLAPGRSVEVTVNLVRRAGGADAVTLEARGLPEGVTFTAAPIAAGATTGRATLTASATAPVTIRTIVVQGRSGGTVRPAPALLVTVRR